MIKIVVVDDHDLVRTGITRLLEDVKGIEVIAEGKSGEEAIELAKRLEPDVLLMDVKMPGIGGLEATRKIAKACPDVKILNVTAWGEDPFPSRLLQAGASGFLTKGADVEEMARAIKTLHAGQKYLSPAIAQRMALNSFMPDSNGRKTPFDDLSDREMQIALMIVSCQKVQEISDKLCLSPKTVNTYRYRIFEKLSIDSDVELTLLAIKHGMLDAEEAV
ncbi:MULTISPECIES: UvrY/SirA/GacA family response regulator transcription factor [Gynuella]|uniref:Response regulator containing a CheY-like receiver domain and an HTH DNA-binding domain n=1 Tax=Gynuella sunshinyii YC6258 TaxID=1445510 RepID=A0A0C5VR01_9GAMM|nr:UvrY/SirA/GacA family response regulator transcription factor [Gynuella sunshinyii]AJQ95823.1 response regulator containing a CheY-like receiver domain and an HTH DNA-binding domain [Gynuella sunshinyii YC6258]